jgi:beta-glucanase (GH16 family)
MYRGGARGMAQSNFRRHWEDFRGRWQDKWNVGYPWGTSDGNMGNCDVNQISIQNGLLVLNTPARNNVGGVVSKDQFLYGTFSARMKIPAKMGTWPSFWLEHDPNPTQEIDVMELVGNNGNRFYSTLHITGSQTDQWRYNNGTPSLANDWHVYSVFWQPNLLTFSIDGNNFFSAKRTINQPMNIMLTNATMISGAVVWDGNMIDANTFPCTTYVDWVDIIPYGGG